MILGAAQLGSLRAQLGGGAWVLFVSDPRIIHILGTYFTTLMLIGEYRGSISLTGELE